MRGERIIRQVDAVEALYPPAILQMIDDLQRRAHGVGGRPHGRVFSVHVENETANGRGGQSAIVHELGPVGVAVLPRVEAKSLEEIQGMFRAQAGSGKFKPQGLGFIGRPAASGKRIVEIVEKFELRFGVRVG